MIQFNSRLLSKRRRIKERKNIDVLLSSDAFEAQGFFYEGGDDHALVVFRDGEETNDGIPWDVVGDAMGATEQLELHRSNFTGVKGSEIFMMKSLSLIRRMKKRTLIQILR
jgi:hypothetical protein